MLLRNAKRKFLLGQTASDLISAHGDQFFAIISHPDATSPAESAEVAGFVSEYPSPTMKNTTITP